MGYVEDRIACWQKEGVVDAATADRLRAYEADHAHHAGVRWQVMLALALGSILLVAGIALFVAAHWDRVSPFARFVLVVAVVAIIHAGAVLARPRFERLAIALHGIGTGAAGIAIFSVGQIFNLQENWPSGILMWLLAAAAGWWLLGDEIQQSWTLLLLPAWAFCEWGDRTQHFAGTEVMLTRAVFLLGVSYMLVLLRSERTIVRGVLIGVGIALTSLGVVFLQVYDNLWHEWSGASAMPAAYIVIGWLLVLAAPAITLWMLRRHVDTVAVIAACLGATLALPHMYSMDVQTGSAYSVRIAQPWTINYLVVAVLAALLAYLGTRERQPFLVNFGIVGFGGTVLWFYFSDVMDKLDRSFSLIVLGLLFVAGGWALEKFRRRIVHGLTDSAPAAEAQ